MPVSIELNYLDNNSTSSNSLIKVGVDDQMTPGFRAAFSAVSDSARSNVYFAAERRLSDRTDALGYEVREWREVAGLGDECTAHGLRKAFATMMADRDVPPLALASALGDTLESAMIYIKKRDERRASLTASRKAA